MGAPLPPAPNWTSCDRVRRARLRCRVRRCACPACLFKFTPTHFVQFWLFRQEVRPTDIPCKSKTVRKRVRSHPFVLPFLSHISLYTSIVVMDFFEILLCHARVCGAARASCPAARARILFRAKSHLYCCPRIRRCRLLTWRAPCQF